VILPVEQNKQSRANGPVKLCVHDPVHKALTIYPHSYSQLNGGSPAHTYATQFGGFAFRGPEL
jgi:hypothetical protein